MSDQVDIKEMPDQAKVKLNVPGNRSVRCEMSLQWI